MTTKVYWVNSELITDASKIGNIKFGKVPIIPPPPEPVFRPGLSKLPGEPPSPGSSLPGGPPTSTPPSVSLIEQAKKFLKSLGEKVSLMVKTVGDQIKTIPKPSLPKLTWPNLNILPEFATIKDTFVKIKATLERDANKTYLPAEWNIMGGKILEAIIKVNVLDGSDVKAQQFAQREQALTVLQRSIQRELQNTSFVTRIGRTSVVKRVEDKTTSQEKPEPLFEVIEVIAPLPSNIVYKGELNPTFKSTATTARLYKFLPNRLIGDTVVYNHDGVNTVYVKVNGKDKNEWIRINAPMAGRSDPNEIIGAYIHLKDVGKLLFPNWNIPLT